MKKKPLFKLFMYFIVSVAFVLPLFAQESGNQTPSLSTFEQPVLITSIGQSPGALEVKMLASRAGLNYSYIQRATPANFDKTIKTLIVVLGVSSKGLGAAGVSLNEEIQLGKDVLARARELGISVIGIHIGGASRRGRMNDKLLPVCAAQVDYLIVKGSPSAEEAEAFGNKAANGNADGLFTTIATEHKIPITFVSKTLDIVPVLDRLFPSQG